MGAVLAVAALTAVLLGAGVLVDTRAEAAFDAPKRLTTLVGIAVAAAALLVIRPEPPAARWSWRDTTIEQRVALVLVGVALAFALVGAIVSPRRTTALDATRTLLLAALLLPLGASRALDGRRARVLIGTFVGTCAVNAAVSLLQFGGRLRLFQVETVGGRLDISAFVGNDGVLALGLVLGTLICLGLVLLVPARAIRIAGGAGLVVQLGALLVNQSLTAVTALATGSVVLLVLAARRRTLAVTLIVAGVLAGGLLLQPGVSRRAHEALEHVRAGDWDAALAYRAGPWAAAVEMARSRPLVGWGPGTFAAEFVTHRLAAEIRFHRRLVNPFLAGAYREAHSEYLQAVAEAGVPAALAAVAALGVVLIALVRAIRRSADPSCRREAIVLVAILCAGAAAALTWFPLQRPITAVPLLLAAGRAWRLSGLTGMDGAA